MSLSAVAGEVKPSVAWGTLPMDPTDVPEDAYGNIEAGSPTTHAFTGREWDPETGLYYYRARYYDPKLGRFISEDPIGFDGGVNFYGYVGGNPVNRVDPTGLSVTGVHNHILWGLGKAEGLSPAQVEILQGASAYADTPPYQTPELAYRHAMSDGTTGQTQAEAYALMMQFVETQLDTAVAVQDESTALWALGMGMHAIMDFQSASHAGFQPWQGGSSIKEAMRRNGRRSMVRHGSADIQCPVGTDKEEAALRWLRSYLYQFRSRRSGR